MTATDFFTKQFGRPPQTDSDKLMVAMMAEYANLMLNKENESMLLMAELHMDNRAQIVLSHRIETLKSSTKPTAK